jgi:hypothetical protein
MDNVEFEYDGYERDPNAPGRYRDKLTARRRYEPSITDRIRAAGSVEEIAAILGDAFKTRPSAATRRRWARAREQRLAELRGEALIKGLA